MYFCGGNADDVTGSCIYIETPQNKILLEMGLWQSNKIADDYKINSRKLAFKPSEIDYVFVNHLHSDHIGLIPRLCKEGFNGTIITTFDTGKFLRVMLKDSAYIINKDAEALTRKYNKPVYPIYTEDDVENAIQHMYEFDFNHIYTLDDEISFEFIPSGHILRAAQLKLYIKVGNHTYKILYTSDLGNIRLDKPYVEKFEPENKCNIAIVESTYAGKEKTIGKKDRQKDLEKLKSAVIQTCLEDKGRLLIPCFSLDRTQTMITYLYDLFKGDCSMDLPVIVDSPLSCKITQLYREVLTGDELEKFEEVLSWKNLRFISDYDTSKLNIEDKTPAVLISSSGMMTAGRVREYLKQMLPDSKNTILFCGYASENTLANKIKNSQNQKSITIDGKAYKNKCKIVDLHSFSSHIQYEDMITYYSSINCQTIYLVHGDMEGKLVLKKALEEKFASEGKSTKICATNKSTVCHL